MIELQPFDTPTVEPTLATAGSASTTSTTARWRSSMAWNDTSGEASVEPISMPGVLQRQEAFRQHGVQPHSQHDGGERHQQHEHAMLQRPAERHAHRTVAWL